MFITQKLGEIGHKLNVIHQTALLKFFTNYMGYDKNTYHYWSNVLDDLRDEGIKHTIDIIFNGLIFFCGIYWIWSFGRIVFQHTFYGWFEVP